VIKNIGWAVLFILVAAILQSTLLSRLALYHAVPDLALGILVFVSYQNGVMHGQMTGFVSGLCLDFLSAAPLGLNALVRTFTGAAAGLLRGTFFLDVLFLPMLLCGGATVFKALFVYALHLLFGVVVPAYTLGAPVFWVELVFNTLLAPFLFSFLKLFKPLLIDERRGVYPRS